ncbi:hypothetical protein C4J93_2720 [Pseudomonas sp. R2-37-08W]|nr:hypothetical protein C4J93_2720 [Pseudomonas sp. R2-37-08W]AZF47862.1 hypothetical protein C4J86_2627 [Pseudomonas sp. R2-7-07]
MLTQALACAFICLMKRFTQPKIREALPRRLLRVKWMA